MIIDCGSCTARPGACTDCVVSFLTVPARSGSGPGRVGRSPAAGVDLDEAERGAISVLARSGLVPPLRMRAG
jgi:hypothetical protein